MAKTKKMSDHDLLIRIDERTDTIHKKLNNFEKELGVQHDRIEDLEGWRQYTKGALVILGGLVAYVHAKLNNIL